MTQWKAMNENVSDECFSVYSNTDCSSVQYSSLHSDVLAIHGPLNMDQL